MFFPLTYYNSHIGQWEICNWPISNILGEKLSEKIGGLRSVVMPWSGNLL